MSVILIRSLILYMLVVFAVRLMGKRQLGELQPSELVITILVSNIATLPLENVDIPVIVGITPILSLVCFEVLVSRLCLRFPKMRSLISGSPKVIITGGELDTEALKELRFSVDDLMMALRNKDVFDLSEVQFAVVETTGSVSVMKKQSLDNPTRSDMGLKPENSDPPQVVISDGQVSRQGENILKNAGISLKKATGGLPPDKVFFLAADSQGNICLVPEGGLHSDKN